MKLIIILSVLIVCLTNVQAKEPALEKGQELYLSYGCAVCHGKGGKGDGISASTFDPKPTNFDNVKNYRHGPGKQDIVYNIRMGIAQEASGMPGFAHIPRKEVELIAEYLISLQSKEE